MADRLLLGISTCPNDTFAFHALLTGAIGIPGIEIEIELRDVQELNEGLAQGRYDVAKGSFFAALALGEALCLLRTGAALGFGNGPLLLAAPGVAGGPGDPRVDASGARLSTRVLGPGRWTTASLLYRLLHPGEDAPRQVVFSEIMPALARGDADFGICIHEGRFTFAEHGLRKVEDLGERWEELTGRPLPLGGIFARKRLPASLLEEVERAIGRSIEHARAHPDEALHSMRQYAQEQTDEVLRAHVALYVNEHTRWLDEEGREAVRELEERARRHGVIDGGSPRLAVLGE